MIKEVKKLSNVDNSKIRYLVELENTIKCSVRDILDGKENNKIRMILEKDFNGLFEHIDELPILDDILNCGTLLASNILEDGVEFRLFKYEGDVYYLLFRDEKCISFTQL